MKSSAEKKRKRRRSGSRNSSPGNRNRKRSLSNVSESSKPSPEINRKKKVKSKHFQKNIKKQLEAENSIVNNSTNQDTLDVGIPVSSKQRTPKKNSPSSKIPQSKSPKRKKKTNEISPSGSSDRTKNSPNAATLSNNSTRVKAKDNDLSNASESSEASDSSVSAFSISEIKTGLGLDVTDVTSDNEGEKERSSQRRDGREKVNENARRHTKAGINKPKSRNQQVNIDKNDSNKEDMNTDSDDSDSSDIEEGATSFSIQDIRKGLGLHRRAEDVDAEEVLSSEEDDEVEDLVSEAESENNKDNKNVKFIPQSMEEELKCSMCLGMLYKPVAASCGHSFCRVCICTAMQKLTDDLGRVKCPTCRKQLCHKCLNRFGINVVLWNVIQKMFPNECKERNSKEERKEFEKALRNLRGDDFLDDYKNRNITNGCVDTLRYEATWLSQDVRFQRTVIRDADDYVMHVAMALERHPDPLPLHARHVGGGKWSINVAVMEMEEDEDEESGGFPAFLTNREDDRALLRRAFSSDVRLRIKRLDNEPLFRANEDDFKNYLSNDLHNDHEASGKVVYQATRQASDGIATFGVELSKNVQPGFFQFYFDIPEWKGCTMSFYSEIEPFRSNVISVDDSDDEETKNNDKEQVKKESKYFAKAMKPMKDNSISLEDTTFEDEAYEGEEENGEYQMDGFVVDDSEPIEMESDFEEDDSDGMEEVVIVRRKKNRKKKRKKKLERKVKNNIIDDSDDSNSD